MFELFTNAMFLTMWSNYSIVIILVAVCVVVSSYILFSKNKDDDRFLNIFIGQIKKVFNFFRLNGGIKK